VASEQEIQLGRLAVKRGFVTEEQVLTALHARNKDPLGPDLGHLLVKQGLLPAGIMAALREAVVRGEGAAPPRHRRDEMSTEHEISLGGAREAIARESLEEARALIDSRRDEAVKELKRLAEEFADTESGNRARQLLKQLGA
jgi:hypothetical protein